MEKDELHASVFERCSLHLRQSLLYIGINNVSRFIVAVVLI